MNRWAAGLVVLVLLVATLGVGGSVLAGPVSADTSGSGPETTTAAVSTTSSEEFDSRSFDITVYENGSATWTFTYERLLSTESEEAEFRAFAEEFETEETDLYLRFTGQAEALADGGADATDREMTATTFDRSASVTYRPNAMGVVEMEFTWENFAPVDDDGTVTVGDVFGGGLYIGPSQTLTIRPGGDLVFATVQPTDDLRYSGDAIEESRWISWSGETDFADGQPRVTLEPAAADSGAGSDSGSDSEAGSDGTPMDIRWLGLLVVLTAGGVGAIVAWRRYRPVGSDDGGGSASVDSAPTDRRSEADTDTAVDRAPLSEAELMTDEDRVVTLIKQNGGRMKQVNIVEETGWSKSKVSMLLSEMETEGTISKLRVGRENIISLRGFEPEAAKSPFEE